MTLPSPISDGAPAGQRAGVPCVRLFAERVVITSTDGLSCDVAEVLVPLVELTLRLRRDARRRGRRADARLRAAARAPRGGRARPASGGDARRRSSGSAPWSSRASRTSRRPRAATRTTSCGPTATSTRSAPSRRGPSRGGARSAGGSRSTRPYPFRVVEHEPAWYARVEPCDDARGLVRPRARRRDRRRARRPPAGAARPPRAPRRRRGPRRARRVLPADLGAPRERHAPPHDPGRSPAGAPARRRRALPGRPPRRRTFPEVRAGALVELDAAVPRGGSAHRLDRPPRAVRTARVHALAPLAPVEVPRGLQATLRPYQAEGVAFLQRLREADVGGVLADEMGLGKTLQTIAHVCIENDRGRLDAPGARRRADDARRQLGARARPLRAAPARPRPARRRAPRAMARRRPASTS